MDLSVEDVKAECAGITFYGREENAEFNDLSKEENVVDIANMAAGFWVEKGIMENDDLSGFFPTLIKDIWFSNCACKREEGRIHLFFTVRKTGNYT